MLEADQIQKIRLVLSSSGWNDVMRPALEARAREAIKALVLSGPERSGQWKGMDDETLRAMIRECEWMLSVWPNEVAVFQHNRQLEELERQSNGAENPNALMANP